MKSLLKHLFFGFLLLLILPAKTLFATEPMEIGRYISKGAFAVHVPVPVDEDHVIQEGFLKLVMRSLNKGIAPESEPRFLSLGELAFSAERLRTIPDYPFGMLFKSFCGTDLAQAIEFGDMPDNPNIMIDPRFFPPWASYVIIDPEIIAYLVKYRKDHHDGSDKNNNYLDENVKPLLIKNDRTPEENDAIMKRIVLNFINHIEPVSIEDETFEVNYWGQGGPELMPNQEARRTLFHPFSKDQLIDIADVCLNADSPFDDASKEEIKAAFVNKGILLPKE